MTSPLDSYTRSMSELRFSDEAKSRLVDALRKAEKNARAETPAKVLNLPARRPARRARRWTRVAAGLALALVLGGGATVAVASGVLPNPADVLSDIFGDAPVQTELLNEVGRPLGASATSNGVTVTAEAVVGDRSSCAVVYSIEFDDPAALEEIEPGEDGTLPLVSDATRHVDGTIARGGGAWFYDADPSDDTIQYVETMGFTTWNGTGIIGRTARFSMNKIEVCDEQGVSATLVSGSWNLKFEMNYVDTTVELPAGQTTTWQGAAVTIDAVAVSSVGAAVDYTIDRQAGDLESSAKVTALPVTVTLTDGTTFDATDANTSNTYARESGGTRTVNEKIVFDRIVSVDDIVSVTVGGAEIPVSAA